MNFDRNRNLFWNQNSKKQNQNFELRYFSKINPTIFVIRIDNDDDFRHGQDLLISKMVRLEFELISFFSSAGACGASLHTTHCLLLPKKMIIPLRCEAN